MCNWFNKLSKIFSNNTFASNNNASIFYIDKFVLFNKQKTINVNNFYASLSEEQKIFVGNPKLKQEDIGFVDKLLELSANEPWCHDELLTILSCMLLKKMISTNYVLKMV